MMADGKWACHDGNGLSIEQFTVGKYQTVLCRVVMANQTGLANEALFYVGTIADLAACPNDEMLCNHSRSNAGWKLHGGTNGSVV